MTPEKRFQKFLNDREGWYMNEASYNAFVSLLRAAENDKLEEATRNKDAWCHPECGHCEATAARIRNRAKGVDV